MALIVLHNCGCLGAGATWQQFTSSAVKCFDRISNSDPRNGSSSGFLSVHSFSRAFILQYRTPALRFEPSSLYRKLHRLGMRVKIHSILGLSDIVHGIRIVLEFDRPLVILCRIRIP